MGRETVGMAVPGQVSSGRCIGSSALPLGPADRAPRAGTAEAAVAVRGFGDRSVLLVTERDCANRRDTISAELMWDLGIDPGPVAAGRGATSAAAGRIGGRDH